MLPSLLSLLFESLCLQFFMAKQIITLTCLCTCCSPRISVRRPYIWPGWKANILTKKQQQPKLHLRPSPRHHINWNVMRKVAKPVEWPAAFFVNWFDVWNIHICWIFWLFSERQSLIFQWYSFCDIQVVSPRYNYDWKASFGRVRIFSKCDKNVSLIEYKICSPTLPFGRVHFSKGS